MINDTNLPIAKRKKRAVMMTLVASLKKNGKDYYCPQARIKEVINTCFTQEFSPQVASMGKYKDCLKTRANLKKQKKHVAKVERVTRFTDLPLDLVGDKILSKVPITSLRAVRSTCKLWNALSREWILSNTPTSKRQFSSFMTMDYKVYSLRFHPHKDKYMGVYQSRKHIDILNQVEISKVFHCNGLLLCVLKDNSGLAVWNPYLGQTRWIEPRSKFHKCDMYALGYDKKRNHKILRCFDDYDIDSRKHSFIVEIYDLGSHSWRVLDVTSDWAIDFDANGASLKGNTYFFAQEEIPPCGDGSIAVSDLEDFLICFDFTNERFGPRLPLPFHSSLKEGVTLSCFGEDQLAVLHERFYTLETLEFWVTTKIEPNVVSWSKFLKLDITQHDGYLSHVGSFVIDEEEKVAMVFDGDRDDQPSNTRRYHKALAVGDGYVDFESLRKCPTESRPPLVCSSSYLPNLVQIN
ncbi:putative F-box protein At4g17200 [Brassica rapa]|nr:putative F-box protein At4g17200 [Brassica rapa]